MNSETRIRIFVAGDFIITEHSKIGKNFLSGYGPINNSIAIMNLEGPLSNSQNPISKIGPHLRMAPIVAEKIKEIGFQIVSLANNHILDMGEKGILDTFRYCEQLNISYVGAGKNLSDARKPLIVEKNGIKIGILSFAEHEFSIATECSPGASPVDPIDNYHDIVSLKSVVDYVFVIYHGGNEYFPFPRPGLQKICRFYVDAGANAVVCHHSHTTSGYEIYNNAPIFYGLGNFFFPKDTDEITEWNYGYSVVFDVGKNGSLTFEIFPHFFDNNGIHLLSGNQKEQFLKEIYRKNEIIANPTLLKEKWEEFVAKKGDVYIYNILSYSRIDRLLFRLNILRPDFFIRKLLLCLNYLRCESHRELLEHSINQVLSIRRE